MWSSGLSLGCFGKSAPVPIDYRRWFIGYREREAECRKQGAGPRRRNQSRTGTGFKLTGPIIYRAVVSCSRLWLFLHVRVVCLLDFMDPGKLMPPAPGGINNSLNVQHVNFCGEHLCLTSLHSLTLVAYTVCRVKRKTGLSLIYEFLYYAVSSGCLQRRRRIGR